MKCLLLLIIIVAFIYNINAGISKPRVLASHAENPATINVVGGEKSNFGKDKKERNDDEKPKICITQGCNDTASSILDHMDDEIDPCDDFYRFTCGKFLKNSQIPDEKSSIGTWWDVIDKVRNQLRSSIREKIGSTDSKPIQLVKILYSSCMNEEYIEKRGLEPLYQTLQKVGGWPVLLGEKWDDSSFNWTESIYKLRKDGFSTGAFFAFYVSTDSKNNTRRIIMIEEPYFGLARKYLVKGREEKYVEAYYNYMVDIAEILGADRKTASKELKEALEFEMKLANITLPTEQRRNFTALYNLMTIRDLEQKYPSIPWLEYINVMLGFSWNVTQDEPIVVDVPSFFPKLENLLKETPKRIQANFLIWRAIQEVVSHLNSEIREKELAYSRILTGKIKRTPRWKECANLVSAWLEISVSSLYVRNYFKGAKNNTIEMVSNIQQEFRKILEMDEWLDEITRRAALEKIDLMESHIAYPQELLNDTKLEEFYKKVNIDPSYYYENMRNINLWYNDYGFSKLREPVDKSDWRTHSSSADVNAYYSPVQNSIEITAGILQGMFYSSDRPKYMNYGAIGCIIGHEFSHGFDDQGSQLDKSGRLVNWWQPATKEKYLNLTQCIIDQYGNYSVPELNLNLNGINTQGENIADNAGIKVAYSAYDKWASQHEPEPRLPGLEKYTPRQMFWMSLAHVWCEKSRLENQRLQIDLDYHSPGEFRVLGTVSNMPEFSRDFNCKLGSKMNPRNKCTVW